MCHRFVSTVLAGVGQSDGGPKSPQSDEGEREAFSGERGLTALECKVRVVVAFVSCSGYVPFAEHRLCTWAAATTATHARSHRRTYTRTLTYSHTHTHARTHARTGRG
jgi:hypothetical protein